MPTLLSAGQLPPNRHDDLDNYDLSDDPFASPSPPSSTKKRKEPPSQGLGIDEEVSVQKRARAPIVKLDEDRLLGPAGLPKLRKRARDLKLKGKGHEFSDAARLLLFYQMWLDDLFPKAKFLDALSLVEKAGHKKRVISARMEVINEGRPRTTVEEDDLSMEASVAVGASENDNSAREDRPQTPSRDAVPDEEDLYGATPRNVRQNMANEDDLDALIAEAEGQDNHTRLLGRMDDDEDDLDALIAEAETTGQPKAQRRLVTETAADQDFADEEAAMLEMDGAW